jgi:hypothetical protein
MPASPGLESFGNSLNFASEVYTLSVFAIVSASESEEEEKREKQNETTVSSMGRRD